MTRDRRRVLATIFVIAVFVGWLFVLGKVEVVFRFFYRM